VRVPRDGVRCHRASVVLRATVRLPVSVRRASAGLCAACLAHGGGPVAGCCSGRSAAPPSVLCAGGYGI
jgi:hypothetical protein